MIALGLRLATAGGRRQAVALLLTGAAVALGTAFLLLAFALAPAQDAQNARLVLQGGTLQFLGGIPAVPVTDRRTGIDTFRDRSITVIDLAASGPGAPRPTEMELPRPGELLISDGLAQLARGEPLLAQRYPPTSRRLPESVVPSPDSLMAVRGFAAADVRPDNRWGPLVSFDADDGRPHPVGPVGSLVLVLGSVAVLAPVVLFTAAATRLTAAGRQRRLAALRLAGATTGQVVGLAGVEALLAGVAGSVAGVGLFFLGRPLAGALPADQAYYGADLVPTTTGFAVALVGVPLAAVLGALGALRRAALYPSEVGRPARPPRIWRLLPLPAAAALFVGSLLGPWTVFVGPETDLTGWYLQVVLPFDVLLAALLYTGPLVTRAAGALLSRAGSPAALLAGRRLTADPRLGSLAVGGAALGTFTVAMFLTVAPALQGDPGQPQRSGLADGVAVGRAADAAEAQAALRALAGTPGVVATSTRILSTLPGQDVWVGDCAALARAAAADPATCAPGRALVAPGPDVLGSVRSLHDDPVPVRATPVVALPPAGLDRPAAVVADAAVETLPADASWWRVTVVAAPDALEQARTRLVRAGLAVSLETAAQRSDAPSPTDVHLDRLLRGALLAAYGVAGCSAALAAATGLLERRRSYALLRMAGASPAVLRRSATLELAVPLLATSAVAAAVGIATGRFVGVAGGVDRPVPWAELGVPLGAGVVIALALGSIALPLVSRVSRAEGTRFE